MYMFPYLAGVWPVQALGIPVRYIKKDCIWDETVTIIIQQIRDHNGDSYMVYI